MGSQVRVLYRAPRKKPCSLSAARLFCCPETPFTLYRTLYKLRTFVMKPSICIPPICELQPESIFSHCRFNLLGDTNSKAQPAQIERCNKGVADSLFNGHGSPRSKWSASCSPYCSLGKRRKEAQPDAGLPTKNYCNRSINILLFHHNMMKVLHGYSFECGI